jgi:hypothetical protein
MWSDKWVNILLIIVAVFILFQLFQSCQKNMTGGEEPAQIVESDDELPDDASDVRFEGTDDFFEKVQNENVEEPAVEEPAVPEQTNKIELEKEDEEIKNLDPVEPAKDTNDVSGFEDSEFSFLNEEKDVKQSEKLNPADLLPADDKNNYLNVNLSKSEVIYGEDTRGNKIGNLQLRADPPVSNDVVSPWLNSAQPRDEQQYKQGLMSIGQAKSMCNDM